MTALSVQMYDIICKYCGQQDGEHCLVDVPYYAVSIYCKYFTEKAAEKPAPEMTEAKPWTKRKILNSLVETF
jgi:hypothetical protein